MERGKVVVGKSTVTQCLSKYPLKFIIPNKVLLEQGSHGSISDRLQDHQSVAMIVLLGPKLKHAQNQIQEDVKKLMSEQLYIL